MSKCNCTAVGLHGVRERDPVASLTLPCVADPLVLLRASEIQVGPLLLLGFLQCFVPSANDTHLT